MDLTARRRKIVQKLDQPDNKTYLHDVNMYEMAPQGDIALSEFEDLALERLQLLRIIEQATLKGHKVFTDDWRLCISQDLYKANLKKYVLLMSGYCGNSEQDFQARRADFISHHILRLAYCRSEELRRWFLNRELEWFKLRFQVQTRESIGKFLEINQMTYLPISIEQKGELREELGASTRGLSDIACDQSDFYCVPFEEVASLVRGRRVFLRKGYAFVPTRDLCVCVQTQFRSKLNEALNIAYHRLPHLDDDRLNTLLTNLHHTYTGQDYSSPNLNSDVINPADLDQLSKQSFPICMRHIHETFKSTSHLKHFARLQFGLFLKAIGLIYEHAMEFWRAGFTKKMDGDKFDKQYAYQYKHMYGKVGNMTSYSPYSCIKIIMTNVGPGECHGCPFRHWDQAVLRQKMGEFGVGIEGVNAVAQLVSNGHYQVACSKYFEHVHKQPPTKMITHPNQYFEESQGFIKEKQKKK